MCGRLVKETVIRPEKIEPTWELELSRRDLPLVFVVSMVDQFNQFQPYVVSSDSWVRCFIIMVDGKIHFSSLFHGVKHFIVIYVCQQ